ncbi:MAG: peptidase U32 family protein [Alishewanella aestuarii]|uniref:Ubiquinone biosynthesis protein UbiU n=1 Tax=Alishewanella aestuarii B11 TaxID=1197174 RepID=J1YAG6_9ALTE|nr:MULTISPECIES: peptidase U32 family protein [Alishewanella]EJI84800.1 collagenase [Alishewanella aestuarii B11]MCT8124978.1 U32 family peptidase [Alishewanella sp. BS5-314]
MELLCPAGSMPAVKAAISQGADAIYVGLKDDTNARHFAGLNFTESQLTEVARYVHQAGRKLHVAINTFAHPAAWSRWQQAVDSAVRAGTDVLILADMAVLAYAAERYPQVELHLSVQASATNAAAIEFYRQFNIRRVVLPRVLSMQQVRALARSCDIDLEVFAFGSLCIMAEGRCYLSSYLTGQSPNTAGACSPAAFVRWQEQDGVLESRLNEVLIDRFAADETAGYPTLCKGRFRVDADTYHVLEEPTSLNTLDLLPQLYAEGISSLKIEGRQRSPAYVTQITQVWRAAIDAVMQDPAHFLVQQHWQQVLNNLAEGNQTTLGAYHRKWK